MNRTTLYTLVLASVSLAACGSETTNAASDSPDARGVDPSSPDSPRRDGAGGSPRPVTDDGSGPEALARTKPTFSYRSMGRGYVIAVLSEVFGLEDDSLAPRNDRFIGALDRVRSAASIYGSPCDVYSSHGGWDCQGSPSVGGAVAPMVSSSIVRQLDKMSVCEDITHSEIRVRAAAARAGAIDELDADLPDPVEWLKPTFRLFWRTRGPRPEEVDALRAFNATLSAGGASAYERWQGTLLLLCERPGWEIL